MQMKCKVSVANGKWLQQQFNSIRSTMMRIILLAIGSLGTAAGEEYGGETCGKACEGEVKEEDWRSWEKGVGELGNSGEAKPCILCKL